MSVPEYDADVANRVRIDCKISAHHDDVGCLADLYRADATLFAKNSSAVESHDLHHLRRRESSLDQKLVVAQIAVTRKESRSPRVTSSGEQSSSADELPFPLHHFRQQ